MTDREERRSARHVPLVRNVALRTAIGLALLAGSFAAATAISRSGRLEVLIAGSTLAWAIAAYGTHKYIHKYPHRYFTYLLASHGKAAFVMAFFLGVLGWAAGPTAAPWVVVWLGFALFVVADALVSALCRRQVLAGPAPATQGSPTSAPLDPPSEAPCLPSYDRQAILERARPKLSGSIVEFIERSLPESHGEHAHVLILERRPEAGVDSDLFPAGLLVSQILLNDIYHLTGYLLSCADRVAMGGCVVVRYAPLEGVAGRLRSRYGRALYGPASVLHFLWYQAIPKTPLLDAIQFLVTRKGNRALSKAEVWGRLSYCGLRVLAESSVKSECYVIAQRDALPVQGKKPSYYPVIALEKVGLDGKVMRLHKLRSMFPYSEFLQKRIYEEHGLTSTGKFANDFRITRFGRFVRKYWLDELPQLFDWLRGDIKLVGIRATSPHYLGLYPKEIMDLYVQVKPGFVSPIFDDSPKQFDQFVEVERTYLKRYLAAPIRTDIVYFCRTWTDIFCRGVRGR
jgi:lipopolysaccharide/colanic/teichoic acid biosynthesis glycosyltransferase